MTKEQFEQKCADSLQMTVNEFHELGIHAIKCDCGIKGCPGWILDQAKGHVK